MFNIIKHVAKDTAGFILIILTGGFLGAALTATSLKYEVKNSISFADIGGMLAGVGTLGLLVVAVITANTWKKSLRTQHQINALNDYLTAQGAIQNAIEIEFTRKQTLLKLKMHFKDTLDEHRNSNLPLEELSTLIEQLKNEHNRLDKRSESTFEALLNSQKQFVIAWAKLDQEIPVKNDHALITQNLGKMARGDGFKIEDFTSEINKLHKSRDQLIKEVHRFINKV